VSQRSIPVGRQSLLQMRTATMEDGSLCMLMKGSPRFWNLKKLHAMTVIGIRPHRWGWKAFEAPGVEPVFPTKDGAIDYAQQRACFGSGEIHILDSTR
jgi:hypothetical protein